MHYRWHAFFDIPNNMKPGNYTLSISNHENGTFVPLCTFVDQDTPCLSTWIIGPPTLWKPDVFTVKAEQPGAGRNATMAVLSAIQQATANGGGTVYVL